MDIKLTLFPSAVKTDVLEANQKNTTWDTAVECFMKPRVADSKEAVQMFVGAEFKPGGKRCGDDLLQYTMLVLDYDDGTHPNYWFQNHADLEFVLYTSWSNTKEHPKFRVVLPLETPVDADEYREAKTVLTERFPTADPAGFSVSQAFYLPSCPEDRKHLFYSTKHKGKKFDLKNLRDDVLFRQGQAMLKMFERQANATFDSNTGTLVDARKWVMDTDPDVDYDTWWKIAACLKGLYGDDAFDLWYEWSESGSKFNGNPRSMQRKWDSLYGETYTFGYLVNRSREYPLTRGSS